MSPCDYHTFCFYRKLLNVYDLHFLLRVPMCKFALSLSLAPKERLEKTMCVFVLVLYLLSVTRILFLTVKLFSAHATRYWWDIFPFGKRHPPHITGDFLLNYKGTLQPRTSSPLRWRKKKILKGWLWSHVSEQSTVSVFHFFLTKFVNTLHTFMLKAPQWQFTP